MKHTQMKHTQLFFVSVLIVLAISSWHNPSSELTAGWWVEQHRPPARNYQVVEVKRSVRLPQWGAYLRAWWQAPGLTWWLLLALTGSVWFWLWQKRVASLMVTMSVGEPLYFHWLWRTQAPQGNLEVRAMVMVSVQPVIDALPAPESMSLLPAGGEQESSCPLVIAPAEPEPLPEPTPAKTRQRQVRLGKEAGLPSRGRQRICLPIEPESYPPLVADPNAFR